MFLAQNFLSAVAFVLNSALTLYMWIIIARAILSWVNPDPSNMIVQILYRLTEPVLYWVRRKMPISMGGLDISPIIVLLGIMFAKMFIVQSIADLAMRM